MKNRGKSSVERPFNQLFRSALIKKGRSSLLLKLISGILFFCLSLNETKAQCPAGTQQAILNWDFLDYFSYTANYTTANGYLSSNALSRTQNFAFGTQRLTITHNYTDANSPGENVTHTGELGTFGNVNLAAVDADVQFIGNGQIVFTFENEVRNLKFTLYDVDRQQRIQLNAVNAAAVAQNVNMATFAGTIITITNNNTPTARADAAGATNVANNLTTAAVDITIAGPVKTVTFTVSNTAVDATEDGSFWISDILACIASPPTFPATYYVVSKPFTGQPGYVLHAFDKGVYAVDPATGKTKLLFTDPEIVGAPSASNSWFVNSMAYDPYKRILYYVFSLTSSPATNRRLKKYDFNTETISNVVLDLNTIGIPTTTYAGVESGSAAFYNGSLYMGIETSNGSRNSGRESVVWRVDFDATNTPYRSSQVFATPVDDGGGTLLHDWADFGISNGVLYDFDGAGVTTQKDVYEYNLLTGATTNFPLPAGWTPGQTSVGWDEKVYQVYAYAAGPTNPYIAQYNKGLGTEGARKNIFSVPAYVPAIPSLGDAAEAYRPLMDFGDAPATYDPPAVDPAMHEKMANLRLGSSIDLEWLGTSSAMADADGIDEDGIGGTPPLLNYLGVLTYTVNIDVFNKTGAAATLVAWLDYNFNGTFDVGEGVSVNVPTGALMQSIPVTWSNITVPNTAKVQTFLRFRLAPATDGLTTSKMNGWIANGEVEDDPVLIGSPVPNNSLNLQALKNNNATVTLNWTHQTDYLVKFYSVQKSIDGRSWEDIGKVTGGNNSIKKEYSFTDPEALASNHYYRLQVNYENTRKEYSAIVSVSIHNTTIHALKVSPNPASTSANLTVSSSGKTEALVTVFDYTGKAVFESKYSLFKGNNTLTIQGLDKLNKGIYIINIKSNEKTETTKLVISR